MVRLSPSLCSIALSALAFLHAPNADASHLVAGSSDESVCLDVQWADVSTGTGTLVAFTCNLTSAQSWNFEGKTIQGLGTTSAGAFCLDVNNDRTYDAKQVDITWCNQTPAQNWFYTDQSAIVGAHSKKCLTVGFSQSPPPYPVTMETCGYPFVEGNQVWAIR